MPRLLMKPRKEVRMSKSKRAPFNNLEEIAARKAVLRQEIALQENRLRKDFDAYQDDVDTLKNIWGRVTSIRDFRKRTKINEIASVVKKPSWGAALSIGLKVAQWLWKRKRK